MILGYVVVYAKIFVRPILSPKFVDPSSANKISLIVFFTSVFVFKKKRGEQFAVGSCMWVYIGFPPPQEKLKKKLL